MENQDQQLPSIPTLSGVTHTRRFETEFFKGEMVYESLSFPERVKKYKETMNGVTETVEGELELSTRYYEILKERIKRVEFEILSGDHAGKKISSIDGVYEYQELIEIANHVALEIISSQKLGKRIG